MEKSTLLKTTTFIVAGIFLSRSFAFAGTLHKEQVENGVFLKALTTALNLPPFLPQLPFTTQFTFRLLTSSSSFFLPTPAIAAPFAPGDTLDPGCAPGAVDCYVEIPPAGTDGQVQYNNSSSFGGASGLFWDDGNNYLGIGDTSPAALLTVGSGDAFQVNSSGQIAAIAGLSGATGTFDFGATTSFEITNGATPTVDANGEIAIDTTVTDFSTGVLKFYSGEELGVVAMPIAEFSSPTDGYVVSYNATSDEFELVASGGGGSVSFGLDNQIPFTNSSTDDFDYTDDFIWDSATGRLEMMSASGGAVVINGATSYLGGSGSVNYSGDNRGVYSIDIQTRRTADTQVASGGSSTALGIQNTVAGGTSAGIGYSNDVSSNQTYVFGYDNTGGANYSTVVGRSNNLSAGGAHIFGSGNVHSSSSAVNAMFGISNEMTGSVSNSSVFGQYNDVTGGSLSTVSGYYNTTLGTHSMVFGHQNDEADSSSGSLTANLVMGRFNDLTISGSGAITNGTFIGYDNDVSVSSGTLNYPLAVGYSNSVTANRSTAVGYNNTASGSNSTAIGYGVVASGTNSFASGSAFYGTTASGDYSTAVGVDATASGNNSTAAGRYVTASAAGASAFGRNLTNDKTDSVMIGPADATKIFIESTGDIGTINCEDPDHDLVIGGTGTGCDTGTYSEIDAGETSFTASSSRTLKENFENVVVDDILQRILDVPVYTYDFIDGSEDKLGLVAEDFHTIFERGSDKQINGQEMTMALWLGVQELTREVTDLKLQAMGVEPDNSLLSSAISGITRLGRLVIDSLEIGSPERPTGITLYDEITGEPYCISVRDGDTVTRNGKCDVGDLSEDEDSTSSGGGTVVEVGQTVDEEGNIMDPSTGEPEEGGNTEEEPTDPEESEEELEEDTLPVEEDTSEPQEETSEESEEETEPDVEEEPEVAPEEDLT